MTSMGRRTHFDFLDFLRGVAAIAVFLLHWFEGVGYSYFHYSNLAVDFFFMLSGFVIAYSYEDKLRQGLPFRTFIVYRVIRLYPLILLGITLGAIRMLAQIWLVSGAEQTIAGLSRDIFLNVFMIPSTFIFDNQNQMFPLDIALWSLFYEFIAYILYAVGGYRLSRLSLLAISLLTGFIVWPWLQALSGHDESYLIFADKTRNATLYGFGRMLLSFSLGIIAFKSRRLFSAPLYLGPVITIGIFAFFAVPAGYVSAYSCMLIYVLIFPAVLLVGSNIDLSGSCRRVAVIFGDLSYPLYVLHTPITWSLGWMLKKVSPYFPFEYVYWGLAVIPATIIISMIAFVYYDRPVRQYLKKLYVRQNAILATP